MRTIAIKDRLREFFFVFPLRRMRIRQLERELSLPLPSVIRYVKELKEEEIVNSLVIGGVTFYTANRSAKNFIMKKRLYNLAAVYDSGIVESIVSKVGNVPIIIFGSFAQGEDTEESDIDLFVEGKLDFDAAVFEKKLQRKIQRHFSKNLQTLNELFLSA